MNKLNGLTRNQLIKAIELLMGSDGIELAAHYTPGDETGHYLFLNAEQMADFAINPHRAMAKYHGVTEDQLQEWKDAAGQPGCTCLTKAGNPCRRSGPVVKPSDWPNRKPRPCYFHGGGK